MDIERGCIEILFRKIPYEYITIFSLESKREHSIETINPKLFIQSAQEVFPQYTEDERKNLYEYFVEYMTNNETHEHNLFYALSKITNQWLEVKNNEVQCKFEELMRWRETYFQVGQDLLTCLFLADYDRNLGIEREYFAWSPIISSNNNRLSKILNEGIVENHFHLNGSTKIFELNWVCLMNHIEKRNDDFKKVDRLLQKKYLYGPEKNPLHEACQLAAVYRVYLFSKIQDLKSYQQSLFKIIKDETKVSKISEVQNKINTLRYEYGWDLDYALLKSHIDINDNSCQLLAGERWFLYACYQACFNAKFSKEDQNIFYRYLVIRTMFRAEMIQVNKDVGFANFSNYESRKELFIENYDEYKKQLVKLAIDATMEKQNIIKLEARISPGDTKEKNVNKIQKNLKIITEKNAERLSFIFHFPKANEEEYFENEPRNKRVREKTHSSAVALINLIESKTLQKYIGGIDACASENNCRAEVFAQAYRYMLEQSEKNQLTLNVTYHAGEDFFDLSDGLRAIDEAIRFCGLKRGHRLGHALALGIDPKKYYQKKGRKLILSKQNLMDDLAWVLIYSKRAGICMEENLRYYLESKFMQLFSEIYYEYQGHISVELYYDSWKLRGDNPECYKTGEKLNMELLESMQFSRYNYNNHKSKDLQRIRENDDARELYHMYHYNKIVRTTGSKKIIFEIVNGFEQLIFELQEYMIKKIIHLGIGIETNPSSNYLIGTIDRYEEHPIIRFNHKYLNTENPKNQMFVSINTDDQGVFDTLLENEFALMASSLSKVKDDQGEPLYEMEDIYRWIDMIRKMGLQQSL